MGLFKLWLESTYTINPERHIATSKMGSHEDVPHRDPNEPYHSWLVKAYLQDVPDIQKAHQAAEKQSKGHSRLVDLVRRLSDSMPIKPTVVSAGAGASHEQGFAPDIQWHGLEYQPELVNFANARNRRFGISSQNSRWSLYNRPEKMAEIGNKAVPASQIDPDWETALGDLPEGENFLYLKHFCGGGTDVSIKKAIEKGYPALVVATCCSHRYPSLSYEIIAKGTMAPEDYMQLVKQSSKKGTPLGLKAQQQIDELRKKYLEANGYVVKRGWFLDPESGQHEATGGYIIAVRRDRPDLVQKIDSPELLQGIHYSECMRWPKRFLTFREFISNEEACLPD